MAQTVSRMIAIKPHSKEYKILHPHCDTVVVHNQRLSPPLPASVRLLRSRWTLLRWHEKKLYRFCYSFDRKSFLKKLPFCSLKHQLVWFLIEFSPNVQIPRRSQARQIFLWNRDVFWGIFIIICSGFLDLRTTTPDVTAIRASMAFV